MNEFKTRVIPTDSELSEAESKIYPGQRSKILIKKWDFEVFKKPNKTSRMTNSTEILGRPFKRMNEKNYQFYAESYVVPENHVPIVPQPIIPARETIKVGVIRYIIGQVLDKLVLYSFAKTSKTPLLRQPLLRQLNRFRNHLTSIGRFHLMK